MKVKRTREKLLPGEFYYSIQAKYSGPNGEDRWDEILSGRDFSDMESMLEHYEEYMMVYHTRYDIWVFFSFKRTERSQVLYRAIFPIETLLFEGMKKCQKLAEKAKKKIKKER